MPSAAPMSPLITETSPAHGFAGMIPVVSSLLPSLKAREVTQVMLELDSWLQGPLHQHIQIKGTKFAMVGGNHC